MKDFKSMYYICNTPWGKYLNYDKIKKFKDMRYSDTIIFHFDFWYSVFKVSEKTNYSRNVFISAINVCLRYYQIINKLYPYNNVRVVIHVKKQSNLALDYNTFKSVLDLIPNFAICDNNDDLFDSDLYKHIFYGNCNGMKGLLEVADSQIWSATRGVLNIREG